MTLLKKILELFAVSSDEDISAEVSFRMSFTNVINICLLFYSLLLGLDGLFTEVVFVAVTNLLFSVLFISYFIVTYVIRKSDIYQVVNMVIVFVYFIVAYINGGFLGYAGQPLILYPFIAMIIHGRRVGFFLSLLQMAIIGVYVSLVMSGIMPLEISYTVQEMINSFILQIVGMGVYYVAIRWMSSLIYDKIHDISILHGELKNKDELVKMLSSQLKSPAKDIEKTIYKLGDERLTATQQDMVSLVKASTANILDHIESINKASTYNVRPIPKEQVIFNIYVLLCNILELYSSREHKNLHSVVMSSEIPQKLYGNSVLCRQVFLSCFEALSRKINIKETPLKIIVSLADMSPKGLNVHFKVEVNTRIHVDHRDLTRLEKKLVETLELDAMQRLVMASEGDFAIMNDFEHLDIEFSLPYVDADLMISNDLVTLEAYKNIDLVSKIVPMSEAKVLIVDDNMLNQKIMSMYVADKVKTVVTASSGKEALSLFENTRFDMIIMDLQMPDMDGFVTSMKIREAESGFGHRVPIIAVSATMNDDNEQKCYDAGMDAYIFKPFKAADLLRIMQSYLG